MIRKAEAEDAGVLAALAAQMWTDNEPDDLSREFRELMQSGEAACFLGYAGDRPVAFAQCQLRHDYAEGTDSSPVGYLEGVIADADKGESGYVEALFVEEPLRRQGLGTYILKEAKGKPSLCEVFVASNA